jgi:mannose-6-phosphate isomerase-like protein (cupin superfamily)
MKGAVLAAAIVFSASSAYAQTALPAPTHSPTGERLGVIDLGKAFPQMAGYELRLSRLIVAPGAGLTLHSHKAMPEIVYIVSGHLTEQRNGGAPVVYGPGATLINDETVTHMVLNQTQEPVVYIGTHVSKPQAPPPKF